QAAADAIATASHPQSQLLDATTIAPSSRQRHVPCGLLFHECYVCWHRCSDTGAAALKTLSAVVRGTKEYQTWKKYSALCATMDKFVSNVSKLPRMSVEQITAVFDGALPAFAAHYGLGNNFSSLRSTNAATLYKHIAHIN